MLRSTARSLPLLLLLAGSAACARLARPETVYLDKVVTPDPAAAAADAVLREYAAAGFTGSVLVARGGRVLLSRGYGDANRARELPNNAETRYPFGALTGMFTASAILELEAEGRLRLDQPAADWVGEAAGDATIRDLLTRAREGAVGDGVVRAAGFGGPSAVAGRFTPPGSSDALLRQVLASATGEPAELALARRVFGPGGLTRTVMDDGLLDDSLVARGYTGPFGETVVVTGLVGPLADLFHWHQALHLGTLLPLAARAPHGPSPVESYALGWTVGRTPGGARVIQHASDQPGFQLWYGYFPDHDLLILLAANTDLGFRRPIAERLTTVLVGDGATPVARGVTTAERAGG